MQNWQFNELPVKLSISLDHARLINEHRNFKRKKSLGNDLLSQGVAPQVPSALTALTTGFGMLPGVPLSLQSPRDLIHMLSLPNIMNSM
jgi:hypothetical protein